MRFSGHGVKDGDVLGAGNFIKYGFTLAEALFKSLD